jgi:antitoxin component YwqK of YwqJK toxin-antitoxin module
MAFYQGPLRVTLIGEEKLRFICTNCRHKKMKLILFLTGSLAVGTTLAQIKTHLYYNEYWWLQGSKSKNITYYRKCTVDTVYGGFIGKVKDYEKVDNHWLLIMEGNFVTRKEHNEVRHRYDGNFVYYFRNGKKKYEGRFANGKKIGLWHFYYGNGQLKVKMNYEEGGKWTILESYDREGRSIKKDYLLPHEEPREYAKEEYEATANHRDLALIAEYPFLKKFKDNTYEKDLADDFVRYTKDDSYPVKLGWDFDVSFPGGIKNYSKMLREKIVYPEQALKDKIEGSVAAQIVVGNDGSIEKADLLMDIGGGCGDEVRRMILEWKPQFRPARKGANLIRKYIFVSVYFELP